MASSNFINECKTPAYEDRLGKIVIDGVEYNQSDNLTSLELDDGIYNNGTIIGSTYTKGLKFSLINVDKDTEFVGKKAIPSVGVKYDNDTTEYIDFDEFTIEALNDEQTKNFTDITGYDSLNILDTKYESDLDEGSHTIGEYWLDLVEKLGLETETPTFTNSTIVIPSNPFVNNESYRTVLSEIEKVSCSFCKVEKRTRTVNNQEEVYHVINLKWFDDYYDEETSTINESTTISDVYKSENIELLGNTSQATSILPSEYTQVDYIESSGTQYINTGLFPDSNLKVETKIEVTSTNQDITVFGSSLASSGGNSLGGYYHLTPYNNKWYYGANSSEGNGGSYSATAGTQYEIIFNDEDNGIKINGTSIASNKTFVGISDSTLTISRRGTSSARRFGRFKYFYFKIYNKDTNALVRDYIPCYRNSDNVVGMYDLVNNVFYTNAGAGAFTYGALATLPNPDYPQDIHVVSGDNTINVNNKNFYNATKNEWTYRNVTASADNQRLYFNGNISSAGSMNFPQMLVKAGTYTLSVELESGSITSTSTSSNAGLLLYLYSTSGGNGSFTTLRDDHPRSSRVVTFAKDTYMYIHAYPRPNETMTNAVIKYQVVKGSVADYDFVPYQGASYPITLPEGMFLGWIPNTDYRDIIFQAKTGDTYYDSLDSTTKESLTYGKWYLNKQIGKVVLNGSESWTYYSTGQYFYNTSILSDYPRSTAKKPIPFICSRFKDENLTGLQNIHDNSMALCQQPDRASEVNIKMTGVGTSGNDLKTWLGTNNVDVYYPLATPTYTEITDTELIEELDSVELQKGLNNISLIGETTPYLKVKYKSDVPNYEFETSDYSTLEGSLTKYGPVNCVLLGNENISGENVYLQDDESITQNGETKVLIDAEYFLYTQALREQAIQGVYDKLNNFEYYDLSLTTYYGKPFLEVGNKIRVNTNEGNVYDTFILQHTFTYDGTFKSVIKSPALTKQENIVKSTESISSRVNRTEIMVDKANGEITSITSRTKYLEDNTYTIEQTNQLIQTAENGLINTFSEAGGNNILRNTGLWFSATTSEQTIFPSNDLFPSGELFTGNKVVYEFWEGNVSKKENDKAVNMVSLNLLAGYLSQEQKIPNGYYVVSFKYKKTNALANSKVKINDIEYPLTSVEDTDFTQIIEVSSQHINIQFYTDIDESCEIYDLMVNAGQTKLAYSQNQNETTTDTVKIGQGITITSSNTDTTFKANADGIRTIDKSGNELTKFTDVGMTTKRMIVDDDSQIVGTLWQEVGGQTWITRL